jgi:hypothetical protein
MRLPSDLRPALADEEVEIGTLMRLHHVLDIEPGISGRVFDVYSSHLAPP